MVQNLHWCINFLADVLHEPHCHSVTVWHAERGTRTPSSVLRTSSITLEQMKLNECYIFIYVKIASVLN
jgi:hypothetical protein